ncbi:CwfJ C-terminus 1-domain-containing protein-like protein [Xylariaceae sp. FL0255]|nr:CwfJ C-terminus 1-domain-containing protein-like protein [Xylariaceae sp. FL0255]
MAAKVLMLGSPDGQLQEAFAKIAVLQKKQNFSFAIITGNLFALDQDNESLDKLLSGAFDIPVSTYFTVGTTPLPQLIANRIEQDQEICENLHYLGKRSITKTSDGIRIVTLGGALDASIIGGQSQEQHLPFHTSGDAKALRGANTTDILLTNSWPAGVSDGSRVAIAPEHVETITSTEDIADLCAALKPRYHFSASPGAFFYEREPFLHPNLEPDTDNKAVTRFLSLAPFGNSDKAKSLYAFNITPGEIITSLPVGCTPSPFRSARKRVRPVDDNETQRIANGHDHRGGGRQQRPRKRSPPPGPDRCFFCLSNPKQEVHMICCIGEEAFVTTAKGPLPGPDHFAEYGLSHPFHHLIISFDHNPVFKSMENPEKTFNEMVRFKEAMQATVASQSKHKLGVVVWEISRQRGIHLHWQFMPVPIEKIRNGLVEAAFKVQAQNEQYPPFEETNLGAALDERSDFFRVWIWSDDGEDRIDSKELCMRIDDKIRFDLQFGRRVMAQLLELESRLNWRDVIESQAAEVEDVEKFKEVFKPWDFTLES